MKNTLNHFKLFSLLLFVVLALTGCKKADPVTAPADPGNNGNNGNNGTVTDVSEKTIDTSGGSLTLGIFAAEIPKNAITTPTKLTLTKLADKPFGTNQKSDIYYLNNLPDVIDQPVVLSLSGFAQTDKVTTLLAESTFVPSLNKEMINYRPIPNTFINGKVQVTLEANANNKSAVLKATTPNPIAVGLVAVSGQSTYTSEQGHFRLTFLTTVVNDAMDLAKYLEEAWSKYNSDPISLSYANRTVWPVEVDLTTLKSTVYGYMATSIWGNNSAYLCFNDTKLTDKEELRITAGHEFFHFVQNLYDPRNRFSKAKFAAPQLWVDEAMAVWAEGMFTDKPNYLSTVRKGNEMSPYSPIVKGVADGASTYGYGMSSMIKFIVSEVGSEGIKKFYDQVQAGQKPAEAIRLATGKFYWEWWGRFVDKNTLGKLYNDIPVSLLVGNKADGFSINTTADSLKEYTSSYGQLQSKIIVTSLNTSALNDQDTLLFTIKNPNTEMVTVYKFDNNSIEKIGQNLTEVSIPGIKPVAQAGYKLLTVVTNQKYDYSGDLSQNITLITRIKRKIQQKVYNTAKKSWFSTISTAIKAAGVNDSLIIYPGTFKEYLTLNAKNLTLTGKGGAATTILESPAGGTGITVMNCSPTIQGLTIRKFEHGIYIWESTGTTTLKPVIDSNVISDNTSDGIFITGKSAPVISNNVLSKNTYYNIEFDKYGILKGDFPTEISHNVISGRQGGDRGIQIQGDVAVEVTESKIMDTEWGIEVVGKGDVTISKDTISGSTGYGISLYLSTNKVTISNCLFKQNFAGIAAQGDDAKNTITGNTFLNNKSAIYLQLGSTAPADAEISQNMITGSGASGIYIGYSAKPGKIVIRGNSVTHCGESGIYLGTSNSVEVSSNTITDNSANYGGGIYASSTGDIVIKQNTISNNKATSYGGGIYSDNSSSAKKATITGNTISGNYAGVYGGGIYGLGDGWGKTAVVTVNKQQLTVPRHVPGFEEGSNSYSGNSNGQKFGAWGPGKDNWFDNAGYDVYVY